MTEGEIDKGTVRLQRFRGALRSLTEASLREVAEATYTPLSLVRAWAGGRAEPDGIIQDEVLALLGHV